MSNDIVLAGPEKTRALLITILRGGTSYHYTDYPINIQVLNTVFVSVPEIVVDFPPNTGGLKEGVIGITVPMMPLSSAMSNGDPQPESTFEIREWFLSRTDGRADYVYRGFFTRALRNYNGDPARVRLEGNTVKSKFGVAAGIPATASCQFIFTKRGCGVTVTTTSGFVEYISSALIKITGHTPTSPVAYWRNGFVRLNGLDIMIRDYDGTDLFLLAKQAPLSWLNRTVTLHPGCDRLAATCDSVWSNILHFGGAGYAIPNYHPVIETP